eukprot:2655812-Alexandrium_andersonii.AAC.1
MCAGGGPGGGCGAAFAFRANGGSDVLAPPTAAPLPAGAGKAKDEPLPAGEAALLTSEKPEGVALIAPN